MTPLRLLPSRTTAFLNATPLLLLLLLSACGTARHDYGDNAPTEMPTERGGIYKIGKPYQIKGQWYEPKEDYSYDETGIASWYGADFHAGKTANGETYNKNELTAAHKTLPMPSLARVTNLENGRSIVVRVNDRGPFSGARIIDVSQRSAQLLGFERIGTAKVRVQVMAEESKAIADAMRAYGAAEEGTAPPQDLPPRRPAGVPENETIPFQMASVKKVETSPIPKNMPRPDTSSIQAFKPPPVYEQRTVTGENKIYIQAGAFTSEQNAKGLQNKLSRIGKTAVAHATVNNVQYYRVRIGPIASVAEADKMLKQVTKSGTEGARIIVD